MTTLASSLSSEFRPNAASAFGALYVTNSFDRVKVWRPPQTMIDAGLGAQITAPTLSVTSAGAAVTPGVHRVRYRYKDARSGYVSNPTESASVTAASGDKIVVTVLNGGPPTTTILIEMTPIDGSDFYVAAEARNYTVQEIIDGAPTSFDVDVTMSDTTLIQQVLPRADFVGDFGHEQPPVAKCIEFHRGRMFLGGSHVFTRTVTMTNASTDVTIPLPYTNWHLYGWRIIVDDVDYAITGFSGGVFTIDAAFAGTTGSYTATIYNPLANRLYWSAPGFVESFKAAERARNVLARSGDSISALRSYAGDLWIFGQWSAERAVFGTDPAASDLIPVPGNRGAFSQRSLVEADGMLFGWDSNGIWRMAGATPVAISQPVDDYIRENADLSQYENFHATFDPRDRLLYWFYVANGDTYPKQAMVCDIDNQSNWWRATFAQEISASGIAPSGGEMRGMIGDTLGRVWALGDRDHLDGVPKSGFTAVQTVTLSGTSMSGVTLGSLAAGDLTGVAVYEPVNGEERIITVGGTTCTLASAFTASGSTEVYIGYIPYSFTTKWMPIGGMDINKQAMVFRLRLVPGTATGKIRVYFYFDFSDSAYTWPNTVAAAVLPDGVSITASSTYVEVDLDGGDGDGYIPVPVPDEVFRTVRAKVEWIRPDSEPRVLDYEFKAEGRGGEIE